MAEKERFQKEREEKEVLAREKVEKEKLTKDKVEKERLSKEKAEKERLAKEKLEKKERLAKEHTENERLAKVKMDNERLPKEKPEKETVEKENVCGRKLLPQPREKSAQKKKTLNMWLCLILNQKHSLQKASLLNHHTPKAKKPKLLNKFDKTIKSEINTAEKLRKKGKVEESLRAFEALVQKYPQSPRCRFGKAQ
ncbi:hypothetical protein DNTS_018464, partial [Danionella cerebrum]